MKTAIIIVMIVTAIGIAIKWYVSSTKNPKSSSKGGGGYKEPSRHDDNHQSN